MTGRKRLNPSLVVLLVALGLAAFACGPLAATSGRPTAAILSPAANSSVPVNEPVSVQVQGSDPDGGGVVRLDLLVDGVTVDTFESGGPQDTVTAELTFTPTVEGATSVAVVAYREDGTASDQTTIALSVVGLSPEAPTGDEGEEDEEEEPSSGEEPAPPPEVTEVRVEAEAKMDIPIREQCGPGCPQIGVWKEGDTGFFYIRTTSPTEWWYWTDYLGENQLGCVYQGQEARNFTLLEDDSILPREPEQGCLYCGDGICTDALGETCDTCEEDCGPCCGNGVCEPEYGEECDVCVPDCGECPYCGDGEVNQDSEECDGGGCGADAFCNDNCQCEEEPEPECGNGKLEDGEGCESNSHCEDFEVCIIPGCYCVPTVE